MKYIWCARSGDTYKKGSAPCETSRDVRGNQICEQCNYLLLKSASILKDAFGITAKIKISGELYVAELEQKNSFDGKPGIEHLYWFTKKTRSYFKDLLIECDEGKVESFINHVESDIGNHVKAKRDPARLDVKNVEGEIKTLEQASKFLSKISSRRRKVLCQPKHNYSFKFENPEDPLSGDIYEEIKANCEIKSKIVLKSLPDLIQDLRSAVTIERRRPGSPDADGDDLAFQIASWFKEFIGRPHPQGGPFPKIVRRCFEICEINRGKNCTRALRYALRKLYPPRLAKKSLQKHT